MKPGDKVRLAVSDHPGTGNGFRVKDFDGKCGVVQRIDGRGSVALLAVAVEGRWLYLDRGSVVRVPR